MLLANPVNQLFGGNALTLGPQHDGGTVGIVGANVVAVVAPHVLVAHPDVGLNVFQQVPQVNGPVGRSEEHTSELQSRPHLVCRLLLEKKNKLYNYSY